MSGSLCQHLLSMLEITTDSADDCFADYKVSIDEANLPSVTLIERV